MPGDTDQRDHNLSKSSDIWATRTGTQSFVMSDFAARRLYAATTCTRLVIPVAMVRHADTRRRVSRLFQRTEP